MAGNTVTIPESSTIEISDVCGLWEVIRIFKDDEHFVSYPWIKDRFKFNFLQEMIFLCLKDCKTTHGSWELVGRTNKSQGRFSIILNGTYEFIILEFSEEEMIISDRRNNYLLVRRL